MSHTTHHLKCGCVHTPLDVLHLAEAMLSDNAIKGFLREAARTTANQLRAALARDDQARARELADWLIREPWE